MSLYEDYIAVSRYARYLPEQQRREDWGETVDRYVNYFSDKFDLPTLLSSELREAIYSKNVMPSMRCLMTAGEALTRENIAGYNCAYLAVDHVRVFGESLYIQMNGTGLGFSVERQYISKLPEVADEFFETDTTIVVRDSKLGWATALDEYVRLLYSGKIPKIDTSRLRPAGAPLKTFGGRASGPWPFERMFINVGNVFKGARGRKLTSIEVHDVMCHIGECVVVGGVRRTSLISLSNHSDERMRHAKMGNWFAENPQRSLSNNSICYTEKPDMGAFMREWLAIYESRSGERGIFNRQACRNMLPERRDSDHEFGCNPCSEIVLRPGQFCNLTEVVALPADDIDSLTDKVRFATILGTLQSCLTDFKFLRKGWTDNCEEERLLGVSITGIYDCPFLIKSKPEELQRLKEEAIAVNRKWAEILEINPSTAITCIKPSGTVSQLCNSSSGCHPRWSQTFTRRVRNDKKDPLSDAMIEAGIPCEEDKHNSEAWVFSFPMKSPARSLTRHDVTPISQLELWKHFAVNWCEHKPSMTCYVPEDSWASVAAWIWENWDIVNGISFLPSADEGHIYEQAPYEDITSDQYKEMKKAMPTNIDWKSIVEVMDTTTASQELACTGDSCEI
jgi:ribonucleoside-diphosphate reductase alpha chain